MTPALDAADLTTTLAQNPIVVVHFWAVWNGYDREADRRLQTLIPRFSDRIAFYSIDFDDEDWAPFFHQIKLQTIPALGCFLNGVWHEMLAGMRTEEAAEAKFTSWITAAEYEIPHSQNPPPESDMIR